ncbi:hypothetical protein CMT42_16465, partial [Elizabethkingia anophelis]|nr:hypothetical protein [Elizabethkingia anophelis]MDV3943321.1 hypothetical protein [Elizabethkingia anophelis]MDV4051642.1 hypothetical protein [Elizabethkingia anophelis]
MVGLVNITGLQCFLNKIKNNNMFNFFKKNKKSTQLNDWEKDLLLQVLSDLGKMYKQYTDQIKDGIIEGVRFNDAMPNYTGFCLNVKLLNKYEKKSQTPYILSNIFILNKNTGSSESLCIHLGFGLVLGYEVKNRNTFNPDFSKIDIHEIKISNETSKEFEEIKKLFSNDELRYINISDVYSLVLQNKKYYHLMDLEDGDFIGIDENKCIYKITHDPFLKHQL